MLKLRHLLLCTLSLDLFSFESFLNTLLESCGIGILSGGLQLLVGVHQFTLIIGDSSGRLVKFVCRFQFQFRRFAYLSRLLLLEHSCFLRCWSSYWSQRFSFTLLRRYLLLGNLRTHAHQDSNLRWKRFLILL